HRADIRGGKLLVREIAFRTSYTIFLGGLTTVLAVMPPAAIYRDARAQTEHNLQAYAAGLLAAQSADRRERINARRNVDKSWVIRDRLLDTCDVYHRGETGDVGESPLRFTTAVYDWLPDYGELPALLRAAAVRAGSAPWRLPDRALIGAGVVGMLFLAALMWTVSRSLFLLDADPSGTTRVAGGGSARWRLERRRDTNHETGSGNLITVDLRSQSDPAAEWRRRSRSKDTSPTGIEILHAEQGLDDPAERGGTPRLAGRA